ncbi:FMN-dependent NADH-azoreductase [Cohnella nanjingensis]|uniref:FMN dependent NADH:quinone oxidoreductase n=1 Tax=Cohnella nanjingensis TaxID=1387779 RepID=A0A7X0VGP3_9BACL|nr:FMN-dependent NADH-azoreductase [Cohnella nanjingensis]MBB6673076.1 FMN-dependent NADH-azoreductase [Cohnella nanjingensis]
MTTTLFVKANNRPSADSVSVRLYEAFKSSYLEAHPDEDVTELDLYQEHLPYMDSDLISGSFKAGRGMPLTPEEQAMVDVADRYLDPFLAADKVVIGFPLWNRTVPAVLHTYIDYLNRAGRTFKYTPQGLVGLAAGKRVVLINARGGDYSEEPMASAEMAVNFVLSNLRFYGIADITTVIVEGHHRYPDRSERIIADGIERAIEAAEAF